MDGLPALPMLPQESCGWSRVHIPAQEPCGPGDELQE